MTDARGAVYLRVSVLAIAAAAIVGPTLVVTNPPALPHPARAAMPKQRVVPQAELPPVEPVRFVDLAPEDARAFNATVPFSTDPNPAARPFRFAGTADDLARATDCLAAGTLYEAGDDTVGERAVAQVVLNRLRHPAFPKTVCGVVFEGETRATGCQFSFSCDGALLRWKPSEDAWRRARSVATAALSGNVYRPVGYATHYHTDWVVPYWQSSLDKIVAVGSHLFFRWSGWWGTPPAFRRAPEQGEPVIAQLAPISDAHRTAAALSEADAAIAEASAALGFVLGDDAVAGDLANAASTPFATAEGDTVLMTFSPGVLPNAYPTLATIACGDRAFCRFMAWADKTKAATSTPLTPVQSAAITFSYLRDRSADYEKALWNCQQVRRPDPSQCMRARQTLRAAPAAADKAAPAADAPQELDGVRRKPPTTPAATAAPALKPDVRKAPQATEM
ncbi:cell wall hydrolase [Sphingomonas sp. CFBP 13714]|uniref:cell wall hydrolase n=1 Tax=Sphingomonas sp. CFBP 13714 TaxID=2775308 RepID=UPI00177A88A6|nr:cell wall hydrolase [Sphingomonas sp. CFBP 13714]MBD8700100.1 cell wall hydrolase [Sphingomonas sp. CFBP 13714]